MLIQSTEKTKKEATFLLSQLIYVYNGCLPVFAFGSSSWSFGLSALS
jgi:hypothetical protein